MLKNGMEKRKILVYSKYRSSIAFYDKHLCIPISDNASVTVSYSESERKTGLLQVKQI